MVNSRVSPIVNVELEDFVTNRALNDSDPRLASNLPDELAHK